MKAVGALWFVWAAAAVILLILVSKLIDAARNDEKRPAFSAFERRACEKCALEPADHYPPCFVEVRSTGERLFSWALPMGLVAARYRVTDDNRSAPALCHLCHAHDRAKLERNVADEQSQLAAYLEGRAGRLRKFQAALRSPARAPLSRRLPEGEKTS